MEQVRVALLGFGGIARSHKRAYQRLEREGASTQLVAICDIDSSRFTAESKTNLGDEKKIDLTGIKLFTDVEDLLQNAEFDMVDICLPSYMHKEYAIRMLKAGKHVLSEKPMALCSADCEEILKVADAHNRKLMIGQCLRFEPAYVYLKKCIDEGCFGNLKSLYMERLSGYPRWGFEKWYCNTEKSGGCIMDLHIHDIDMARFLLGEPESVSAISYDGITRWQMVNSRLFYKDAVVIATGSWDETSSFPFTATFRARFENANVVLDNNGVVVYPEGGDEYRPELASADRMAEEIRKITALIMNPNEKNLSNPPESAYQTVRLIEALRESAEHNGQCIPFRV